MGCDIHSMAERKVGSRYEAVMNEKFSDGPCPFSWRAYGMFGFLAGVRNYSGINPIADVRGVPNDASDAYSKMADDWSGDAHSHSWVSVDELLSFNYETPVEDRRVTRMRSSGAIDGGCTCEPGEGSMTTYREFLGDSFFSDLQKLVDVGASRVVFFFDN